MRFSCQRENRGRALRFSPASCAVGYGTGTRQKFRLSYRFLTLAIVSCETPEALASSRLVSIGALSDF